ncbi:MAG TPA: MerR family transcriptional regulator [Acidimicrobiales bacterium]|nr:MerR family transcriptional regulator [Acidimicrobiales bacterium]
MSGRTYLSIGDVLALLRQEFPDVTISKIRFLESQGLVDPERTPSGYRKFYDHDVERLRWVLRQQREHFLPLKVIKGRLEQEVVPGDGGNGHDGAPEGEFEQPMLVTQGAGRAGPATAGEGATAPRSAAEANRPAVPGPSSRAPGSPAGVGPTASPAARAPVGTPPRAPAAATPAAATPAAATPAAATPATTPTAGAGHRAVPVPPARPDRPRPGAVPGGARETAAAGGRPGSGPATPGSRAPGPGAGGRAGPEREQARPDPGDEVGLSTLSGTSLTAEELAQASGLEVAGVEELESYGLVCGRVVGGVTYYGEDALTVARLAAGFARYGVEARHLRLHKHAAEREAGFIEQIVLPLLKQRNPEARQRARDTVADLSTLGQRLREALVRTTLRDQLGG